jgi:hypothetical protein
MVVAPHVSVPAAHRRAAGVGSGVGSGIGSGVGASVGDMAHAAHAAPTRARQRVNIMSLF